MKRCRNRTRIQGVPVLVGETVRKNGTRWKSEFQYSWYQYTGCLMRTVSAIFPPPTQPWALKFLWIKSTTHLESNESSFGKTSNRRGDMTFWKWSFVTQQEKPALRVKNLISLETPIWLCLRSVPQLFLMKFFTFYSVHNFSILEKLVSVASSMLSSVEKRF